MQRAWLIVGLGVVSLLGSGVLVSLAGAQAGGDPATVIAAYEMARNRRDFDAALTYFADDAWITTRSSTYSGKDEIRKYLDSPTRSRFVVVSDRRASGTRINWTERSGTTNSATQTQTGVQAQRPSAAEGVSANPSAYVVNVEAVVQDGKIRSLTFLATTTPLRPDPALEGRAQLPASIGLGAVLVVLLGTLLVASIGLRRSTSRSTLQGRLMHDLQGWSAARQ
jgi:hypothetical protein